MASKSINEHSAFTGSASDVNILVQEKSQGTDHLQAEHKKAGLSDILLSPTIGQDTDKAPTNKAVDDAISALGDRVDAIEETLMGENEITVQYPDDGNYSSLMPNKVPLRALKYAEVPRLRGKSRAWNQLYKFKGTGSATEYGITFTYNSDGTVVVGSSSAQTATGLAVIDISNSLGNYGLNHKILVMGCPSGGSSSTYWLGGINSGEGRFDEKDTGSGTIISVGSTYGLKDIIINIESGTTINSAITFRPIVRDLTLIFGAGNEPSTVADALAQLPALGQYNPYDDGSLVSTTVEGVEAVGVNIWDEEWEVGDYNASNGEKVPAASLMRCKNRIPIRPSATYYIKCPNVTYTYYYDVNGDYLNGGVSHTANSSFTVPSNAYYMTFNTNSAYGTTYNNNIQICDNNYTDKTTSHPYVHDTLSLPEPVTLRSARSAADEYTPESGEVVRNNSDEKTLSSIGLSGWDSSTKTYVLTSSVWKKPATNNDIADIVCSHYQVVSRNNLLNYPKCACMNNTGTLIIRDASWTGSGDTIEGTIVYALATPTTESIDPVLNNFLEVEGGGTIETIQTQSPVIDNCLDVTYDIIPQ